MMKFSNHKKKGFTLIEMMVAVTVFSIVMTIATGAIFSIVSAYKTSQALKSVMDNLSSALDTMSRDIRYGTIYNCGNTSGDFTQSASCSDGGDTKFAFVARPTLADPNGAHVIYEFQIDSSSGDNPGSIYKCINNNLPENCIPLTAPEVHITDMHFYVQGAGALEAAQPKLLITISGYAQAGSNQANRALFNIETMVSQRSLTMCKDNSIIPDVFKTGISCP